MSSEYEFSADELDAIRQIVDQNSGDPFVEVRRERNVDGQPADLTRERIWRAHVIGLMSSRAPSGPDSAITRFLVDQIDDIGLSQCRAQDDVASYVSETLKQSPHSVSFYNQIGKRCARNLQYLEDDDKSGWKRIEQAMDRLQRQRRKKPSLDHAPIEREVCSVLRKHLTGIGHKQARNVPQMLGLTRYEVPLDRRVDRWVQENLYLPEDLAQQDAIQESYVKAMDWLQTACKQAGVVPCVFDAAVFANNDHGWTRELLERTLP